jgi:chemotaxis protein methyltransferase CheR
MDLAHVSFTGIDPPSVSRAGRTPVRRRSPAPTPRPGTPKASAPTVDSLAASVLRQQGLSPTAYRAHSLRRRLPACLRQLRAPTSEAAERILRRAPHLLPSVLDTLLIGVTAFFRDAAVFEQLRAAVLPELLRSRPGIRVYAAGVSSGHELYSVAMMLDELSALEQSDLLGLDCRSGAIDQACAGIFAPEDLTNLSAEQRERYFPVDGGRRRACPRLRTRINWHCGDLMAFDSAAPRHLILFRNVAIYLEPEAALRAWKRLCDQLERGGFIVSGKAEQPPPAFPLTRVGPCIFRRV